MPELTPFKAIRFDATRLSGDLTSVLAPPYDVLDQSDKDALLKRSDRNIVALDLPHIPPKSAGPATAYEFAATELAEWLSDGTLIRESKPAIYLYHQRFEHAGKPYTRRMFIARLRLASFSEGSIRPHEQTFGGPKEDRLALMKATKCQLSPIFGLYADATDRIGTAFIEVASKAADVSGRLDGVENTMWVVCDRGVIDTVTSTLADEPVYIADGHHRYGTALMYRDFLADQLGGSLPPDHPANYVMFVLASMNDPGCLILPYNRALAGVDLQIILDAWLPGTALSNPQDADVRLFDGKTGDETPLRFTNRAVLAELEPKQCDPWRKLDYAYLHRYLIDELLATALGCRPTVRYVKSLGDAKQTARDESGVALLTNATPMAHIRAVSDAGGLMPPKSTYFHPKLATGLTINPLSM